MNSGPHERYTGIFILVVSLDCEEQQEYIKLIQISGARMLNLISEIIDISKIESGMMEVKLEEVDVNREIDFVFDVF
jgi:signal transduction histidine kinase